MLNIEVVDGIATVALARPERLNALSWEVADRIADAVRQLGDKPDTKVIVLTGEGRAFCAGADLSAVGSVDDLVADIDRGMYHNLDPMCEAFFNAPVPTVVAVNGPCAGGGVGLALLADITVAARSAYFLIPQVQTLGLVPDVGATWAMPRLVGRARSMGMSLLGERVSAEQAEEWGLIWRCFDDEALADGVGAIARRLAQANTGAITATRRLIKDGASATLREQLTAERLEQVPLLTNPTFAARLQQFAK